MFCENVSDGKLFDPGRIFEDFKKLKFVMKVFISSSFAVYKLKKVENL